MKRTLQICLGLAAFLVIAALATPKLLSTDYVKDKISAQLRDLSGRPVSLQGGAEISLSPYLGVSYNNVRIGETSDNTNIPLVEMDQMRVRLSTLSAFWGEAEIARLQFVRPQFNLRVDTNGQSNWKASEGAFSDALAVPIEQQTASLGLGEIEIVDGSLRLDNELNRQSYALSAINGSLNWPEINQPASTEMQAVWRGENVTLNATATNPIDLFRGGKSNMEIEMLSTHLGFTYSGVGNLNSTGWEGQLTVSSKAPRHTIKWLGYPIDVFELFENVEFSSPLMSSVDGVSLTDVQATFGSHSGSGRLQLSFDEADTPTVAGTLAFDTVNLPDVTGIVRKSDEDESASSVLNFPQLDGFNLDLRLSADSATKGTFTISNLAAAVLVREQKASFDIGQAEFLEGTVSGSVGIDSSGETPAVEYDLLLNDIDLEEFLNVSFSPLVSVDGKGNVTIKLKSKETDVGSFLNRLNGEIEVESTNGTLTGIDLPDILENAADREEKVWNTLEGETSFDTLRLSLLVANGIAFARGTELTAEDILVELGGRSDLAKNSLALRGTIKNRVEPEDESGQEKILRFFVGGTAASPLFVPLRSPAPINQ